MHVAVAALGPGDHLARVTLELHDSRVVKQGAAERDVGVDGGRSGEVSIHDMVRDDVSQTALVRGDVCGYVRDCANALERSKQEKQLNALTRVIGGGKYEEGTSIRHKCQDVVPDGGRVERGKCGDQGGEVLRGEGADKACQEGGVLT